MKGLLIILSFVVPAFGQSSTGGRGWPLWQDYSSRFLGEDGRIIDFQRAGATTSEGQAYALFFSLVADDRPRFQKILQWTQDNLSGGDLRQNLPAWHWGKSASGLWKVQDVNSASDADLWFVYTLLQAGRLWDRPELRSLARSMGERMVTEEVVVVPGIGPILLPGRTGFHPRQGVYELNASYLPLQLVLSLGHNLPNSPWLEMADAIPWLIKGSAPEGFALDWIAYTRGVGFSFSPVPVPKLLASYDAIRVYLWAGMLDSATVHRQAVLETLRGMTNYLRTAVFPPSEVAWDGKVINRLSGPGFSAAILPFLMALDERRLLNANVQRLEQEKDSLSGLYGHIPSYYDQNLALFGTGYADGRFRFNHRGDLLVNWSPL